MSSIITFGAGRWAKPIRDLLLLFPIALTCTLSAHSAIVECAKPGATGYSVYLDEPVTTPAAFDDHSKLLLFLSKLQFALDQNFDEAGSQGPGVAVRFVECVNRMPAQDASDFANPAFLEALYNQSTLLEIWGSLDATRLDSGRVSAKAQMNYMLVPIQFATQTSDAPMSGLVRLEYPIAGAKPTSDFVELLSQPQDIQALIAASLGYKALRERKFEVAHVQLCQSSLLLGKMAARLTVQRQKHDASALRDFVIQAASRSISEALKDPSFARSTLQLQKVAAPCPLPTTGGPVP
jgi:hypothetical protein